MPSRTRSMRRSATITDVAALAGVAPMTVSRTLNTPERVSPETIKRVRQAIDRLNYVPNLIAGGLSSRRSRMIAAIVPSIATPIYAACVQSFTRTLEAAGYHVMLGLSGYAEQGVDDLVPAMLGRRPDGMLLTGVGRSASTRRRLRQAGIPVVEVFDAGERPIDMLVGFDHRAVGAAVADFFAAQGFRDYAVIAADDPRAVARRDGFAEGVARGGGRLVAAASLPAPASIPGGRAALREMLPRIGARTALFCSSDLVAAGAILEAGARGIAVPERLAVCGFGDLEIGQAMEPAITTMSVDSAAIGRTAAELLLRRAGGERDACSSIRMPFHIERRASA